MVVIYYLCMWIQNECSLYEAVISSSVERKTYTEM
jgi:hypothetical protein